MATNTNILFPQTPFIDPSTGRPSLPWVLWLQNPSFVNVNLANALPISSGGTGISTAPTNGQLLIGNAGVYSLHTLTPSSGISVTNGAGLITVANTGVLSNIASSGISVSGATGNVTIANTGVLSAIAGSGISVSGATGNVTFANTGVLSFSGGSTGLTPATATTGAVSLAGTLAVAYGGTGQTTYTDGQLLIGNTTGNTLAKSTLTAGTGISISNGSGSITIANTLPSLGGTVTSVSVVTANGLAGTVATATTTPAITLSTTITGVLKGNGTAISAATSGTDYAPATSGTSILYGNGSGGFSNVTIGSGISFVTGTLSATGSGGTVTSVGLSLPSIFTVSGSPVTGTGTLTGTFNTQTANYVFAGPTTGAAATPTFRALVSADIPNNAANTTGYASNIAGGLAGSIPYQTAVNATSLLGIGTTGQILRVVSGLPAWGTDYVGTVTSVSALTLGTTGTDLSSTVANGTTTPVITLNVPTASATNRGALSSTDWTTFNNKGSGTVTSVSGTTGRITSTGGATPVIDLASGVATAGTTGSSTLIPVVTIDTYGRVTGITTASNPQGTVTSVAALTLGTTGTDLSSTVANGTTTPVITLNVPTASATNRGALSAADWTTFNNKQPAGTYVTSVTGTAPVVSSGGTTPAISMAAATTSVNGYLTSTDWNTFNGKQAALVSATNIKTVSGVSLLGSGDVGTIGVGYGGTGQTTFTAGYIHYGSFSTSSNLTFDGTNLSVGGTVSNAGENVAGTLWVKDTNVINIGYNAYRATISNGGAGPLVLTPTSGYNISLNSDASVNGNLQPYSCYPQSDNAYSCGTAAKRWSVVYAATALINTSDERTKEQITTDLTPELKAWAKVEYCKFKFKDSVAEKSDGARWHIGLIAQRVKEAFESEGLDAFAYGILCYDKWDDKYTTQIDEKGNETGKTLVTSAGDIYGIRYEEALALECAYLRSKLNI